MAEINAGDKKIKGVFIQAGGDIKNNGVIRTDKDAIVSMQTLGKYESDKGQIIQGEEKAPKERWWNKTWVQVVMLLGAVAGIISLIFLFKG